MKSEDQCNQKTRYPKKSCPKAFPLDVPVQESEQCQEGLWFYVWKFYLVLAGAELPVEHGIKDCTAHRQHKPVGWNPLARVSFTHQEVNITQDLIVKQEGKPEIKKY